jgi:hypothetical protein
MFDLSNAWCYITAPAHASHATGELYHFANVPYIVTHQASSPTWIKRVSRRRVRLADIQIYVFCQNYRQQRQRRGNAGAFELAFTSEDGKSPQMYPGI